MKAAIYFAILQFGSSLLFLIIEYNLWPKAYPGETLLIIWFYMANIFIGMAILPLFFLWMKRIVYRRRAGYILSYFLCVLFIINLIPFLTGQVFYTPQLIIRIFSKADTRLLCLLELMNPLLSFLVAYTVLRNSHLWLPKE